MEFPAQNRYIIAFPLVCGHFAQITNEFCPEEKIHIRERSLSVVNLFLDEMSKEAKNIITTICDEQCNLSDRLLPKHCAGIILTEKTHYNLMEIIKKKCFFVPLSIDCRSCCQEKTRQKTNHGFRTSRK